MTPSPDPSGPLQSSWVRKASEVKRLMFDFFAFPGNCLLLLLVLFCFIFFADCRNLHMYSWNIVFVCASCVCFAGSQWTGCSKCEILVSTEEAMWGAGTAQTQWSCPKHETHCQYHLHHLGQQPPLQQQWEDQWSCPHGCCFYFIPSTITTVSDCSSLGKKWRWGFVVLFYRWLMRSSICAHKASLWIRSLRVMCHPAREFSMTASGAASPGGRLTVELHRFNRSTKNYRISSK